MKFSIKQLSILACAIMGLCTTYVEARTFAERGKELGQKLDDAEAKLKKEVEEAKKKAQEASERLKKKTDKVAQVLKEEQTEQEAESRAASEENMQ